jgi:hypothetical protein
MRFALTRYGSLLADIERQLSPDGKLVCRFGAGRVYLVLRGAGASRWELDVQLARAMEMTTALRATLGADSRGPVRAHAGHAVVVRFEDATVAGGCEVRAHWECIVPSPAD